MHIPKYHVQVNLVPVDYCHYSISAGPLPETVKDFWQMIWDHKLQTIVMLTKPVEAGTPKCAVYWPEKVNETLVLKPSVNVRMTYLQYFADFDMRVFEVTNVRKNHASTVASVIFTNNLQKNISGK